MLGDEQGSQATRPLVCLRQAADIQDQVQPVGAVGDTEPDIIRAEAFALQVDLHTARNFVARPKGNHVPPRQSRSSIHELLGGIDEFRFAVHADNQRVRITLLALAELKHEPRSRLLADLGQLPHGPFPGLPIRAEDCGLQAFAVILEPLPKPSLIRHADHGAKEPALHQPALHHRGLDERCKQWMGVEWP